MEPRLDAYKRVPGTLPAIRGLENLVRESGLEAPLLELVRIRASQMNGCAYCLALQGRAGSRGDRAATGHVVRLARDGVFHGS